MKNNALNLLIFLLLVAPKFSYAQPNRVRFDHLTTRDGLSQSTVNCMTRDKLGYMWFGTNDGLNRYNGYQFEVYRPDETSRSISHASVLSLAEDEHGLWVGTANGLNYYDARREAFTTHFYDSSDNQSLQESRINSLLVDHQQRVWIGTAQGVKVYDPVRKKFSQFPLPEGEPAVQSLLEDHRHHLWVGTAQGLFEYDQHRRLLHWYHHDPSQAHSLSDSHVFKVFEDAQQSIWVGTRSGGLNQLEPGGTFRHFRHTAQEGAISNDRIKDIATDQAGKLWVATFEGLNRYDYATGTFEVFSQDLSRPDGLTHFHVWSLYHDPQGVLWIGTYAGGINVYSPFNQRFHYRNPAGAVAERPIGKIGPMVEDGDNIWIASEGGGLIAYHRRQQQYQFFPLPSDEVFAPQNNIIKALMKDRNGRLWIGTHDEGIHLFDPETRQFVGRYQHQPHDRTSLSSNIINVIYEDQAGYVWIGTHNPGTLNRFDPDTKTFQSVSYRDDSDSLVNVYDVKAIAEHQGKLYFGTGGYGMFTYDQEQQRFARYTRHTAQHALPSNWIQALFHDRRGDLWIGTDRGALRWSTADSVQHYTTQNGLPSNNIGSFEESASGFLWMGTLAGVARLDRQQNTIRSYSYVDGFPINELNQHASLRTSDGLLFWGGDNGFVFFDPHQMVNNEYVPKVVLSDLQVFNQSVAVGDESELLDQPISQSQQITLNYRRNVFTINFFSTNLISPEENQYAFRLDGLEEDWNEVGPRRSATYTNLAPGAYTFLVKTANNDGVWSAEPTALQINVLPPPWKTWWAYGLYALMVASLLLALRRYWYVKATLEKNLALEQLEHQQSEEVHRAKIAFFTNVSHEFRTPLTLILGPLQSILRSESLRNAADETVSQLRIIERNAHRLLRLVNQLLDLQKYETDNIRLQVAQGDLVKFVNEIYLSFLSIAEEKSIDYTFCCESSSLTAWYDRDELEKVFLNLLINAFKYTARGGSIKVVLAPAQLAGRLLICVSVHDTGTGIPPDQIDKVFERFYQATNVSHHAGTGIGLSLAKSIVEMHHGLLEVQSDTEVGTTFHTFLPSLPDDFAPEEIIADFKDSEAKEYYQVREMPLPAYAHPEAPLPPLAPTVLVVEDNPDVRTYVSSFLNRQYHVLEADNGQAGWELAQSKLPDLVISDVMMPVSDGITLCKRIKKETVTQHIPVILLTARTAAIHQKEGLGAGADDYITKPFEVELLKIKVENLIASRRRLRTLFGEAIDLQQMGIEATSYDVSFLEKITHAITERISDPQVGVADIAREVGFSRSQLHRKLKELTGCTISEFVRNIRLKAAAKMLREYRMSISEVSDQVGFSSHAYFTKCFKDYFHLTPAQYAKQYYSDHVRSEDK
jgi:ligand-binding sensor domain-containing protein/signal transduction histidine kinase/DNA-binding response OmpR family regulator